MSLAQTGEGVQQRLALAMEFVIHVVVGTVIFATVLVAAAGLSLLIHWCESAGMAQPLTLLIGVVEGLVVLIDLACYAFMVVVEAYTFVRKLLKEAKADV